MKKILLLLFGLVFMIGCTQLLKKPVNIAEEIEGKTYVLQETIDDSKITLHFSEGRLTGTAGVNLYFSSYRLSGNKISVGKAIGSTMMAGPENLMQQERDYLENLADIVQVALSESVLTLTTNSGNVLSFEEESEN